LFLLESESNVCLGSISGSKFCLKPCVDGKSCGIPTHATRKARVPTDFLFVMENDSKAFCDPRLDASRLEEEQLAQILRLHQARDKWSDIFNDLEQGVYPLDVNLPAKLEPVEELEENSHPLLHDQLDLVSPKKATEQAGIFSVFPTLSYDDDVENGDGTDTPVTKESVRDSIKEFNHRFARLKSKWTSAFQDVEVSHLLVTADLAKVSAATDTLTSAIGAPPVIDGVTFNSVWQAILHVSGRLQDGFTSLQESMQHVTLEFDRVSTQYQQNMATFKDTVKRHESRFAKILPILMNMQTASTTSKATSLPTELEERLHELSQAVEELKDKQWQTAFTSASQSISPFSAIDERLCHMESQIQGLQMRIVGNGVQIGGTVFQCFEDVKVWITAKFPIKRYGLFVDGVSLLDFFTFVSHVDTEKSMTAYYNQQKSGFASMYEARLAASTQNLFPMVFGRSNSTGMDDSEYLPALQDPDKWDNGITGLRYQISRGMGDVEFQLESTIDSILKNYPEPRQIAKECLYKSKRFVTDLCNFITQDFQKWQHRGHSKKDSWRMTTVCVRRIFEEIHSQRVVARDILDVQDGDFSCAKFLWATWKALETMSAYVRHQFYEHPSIAAVLARHLADNHVKPDEAVTSRVSSLDKAIKNINARMDTLQSSLNSSVDKTEDKLREVKDKLSTLQASVKEFGNQGGKFKKNPKATDKTSTLAP
jgi:predicted  nucleic acid-binding Zn-ribbon protein